MYIRFTLGLTGYETFLYGVEIYFTVILNYC